MTLTLPDALTAPLCLFFRLASLLVESRTWHCRPSASPSPSLRVLMSLRLSKNPSWNDQFKSTNQRDFNVQVAISVVFGLSAFLSFCVRTLALTSL